MNLHLNRWMSIMAAATVLQAPFAAQAADIETHTPNIQSPHLVSPGQSEFSFTHRFSGGLWALSNSPTFWLEGGIVPHLAWQLQYATKATVLSPSTDVVQGSHDLNASLREGILDQSLGAPVTLSLQEGFEAAAFRQAANNSVQVGETDEGALLTLGREFSFGRFGGLGLVGTLRGIVWNWVQPSPTLAAVHPGQGGVGYGRASAALGVTYQITPYLSIAGDWGKYLDGLTEVPAWSAAIEGAIPYTPHQFTLEVSDVPTVTMAGQAQSTPGTVYYGFSYLIPFSETMSWTTLVTPDWAKPQPVQPAAAPASAPASAGTAMVMSSKQAAVVPSRQVVVHMKNFAFDPQTLTVPVGTTVTWVNDDPVVHTATAQDQSWNAGNVTPGASVSVTFTHPGTFPYYCIPHESFMKGTLVVTPK